MAFSAKTIRKQLALMKPFLEGTSLETVRRAQEKIGELMGSRQSDKVIVKEHKFNEFSGAWIIPKDERRQGVILYFHGGGFTSGELEYAKGFGTTLAIECGMKVFCVAYRLAPENRFPAAIDDCVLAYKYLLEKGYTASNIAFCGESAGGGLCYSICVKLKMLGVELPRAIIAISPWTDLTLSGQTYEANKNCDPSMTKKILEFYANSYIDNKENPMASPLFADLKSMPPSLIFVGADEIMLDDSVALHRKLLSSKCFSKLVVKPKMWHAYLLYGLQENNGDFGEINRFLNENLSAEKKLRWLRLDNAAKIYPAARSNTWSNVFRLSATLKDPVDCAVLQSALDVTVRRFPSISARLRRGAFWYYLEELSEVPKIREEHSYPLERMSKKETSQSALRVKAYKNRIAVEFFHSLTDGNGALVFLKTLLAEYIQQKYGVYIPAENGVLGRLEEPSEEELEDSFLKYSGAVCASRKENTAWHLSGTPTKDGFLNLTCFKLPVADVLSMAHKYNVSLTAFLCAVMMQALLRVQEKKVPNIKKRKPVKVLIPVNLRRLFKSKSLRNFALYTTPEIDARLGKYSFEEICKVVHHHMGLEVNAKHMSKMIATNVGDEKLFIVKIMPLFIKNIVMKAVFNAVGECKSCLSLSNLGAAKLPDEMKGYIERLDFILGVQASAPHNCGVISYGDTLYINFIRDIEESELEYEFHQVLRDMGIVATVESNIS